MSMFERFTGRARHSIVLAQEEARLLQHNYIGTEHILLGLLGEPDGLAGRALAQFGMSLTTTRELVEAKVGRGKGTVSGHIPFTPRAKKVLELALREALQLHHNYIGTEHVLLGVIREGDGVGAQIVREQSGDLLAVRMAVLDLVPAGKPEEGRRWLRRRNTNPFEPSEPAELRTTVAADTSLDEAARLAGSQPVGSHHLLLAALSDPNTAAARVLATFGLDLEQAKEALRAVDVTGTTDELPEDAGRRQMVIRVAKDSLSVETTDPTLIRLGQLAIGALSDRITETNTIRGDAPTSTSVGNIWSAIEASLQDISRRAAATAETPPAQTPTTATESTEVDSES
jgi:ATP-dependent Clp protease ATP-binding subunit ClpC